MHLLISHGAQGDDHHVETVKPAPVLNVMKAHRTRGGERDQGNQDDLEWTEFVHRRLQRDLILEHFRWSRKKSTADGKGLARIKSSARAMKLRAARGCACCHRKSRSTVRR